MPPRAQDAAEAGLVYVAGDAPGLCRRRAGKGFCYRNADGRVVRDKATLARIRALAIPPAWTEVWICAEEHGHLQAAGRDARGRRQHRYHARFRQVREAAKFGGLAGFAQALPALRCRVAADMRKLGLPREKVLATVVQLLDATLIRIGNEEYARANKSYGLTTLHERHARVEGGCVRFVFTGKSGKSWRLTLRHRRVAAVIRAMQELPGQRLFQYEDESGAPQRISSTDVNAYLREASGADITAKDFRTWGATVLAAAELDARGAADAKAVAQANVKATVERVAASLGNTAAICRKCYIHPQVIAAYLEGRFALRPTKRAGLSPEEASVLAFLRRDNGAARAA